MQIYRTGNLSELSQFHFTGIIGVVLLHGKEYRIATYLGATVKHIGANTVTIKQGNYTLTARLQKKNAQPLLAPSNGKMCRTIHESASCRAYYRFSYKNKLLCEFSSNKASFEFEFNASLFRNHLPDFTDFFRIMHILFSWLYKIPTSTIK